MAARCAWSKRRRVRIAARPGSALLSFPFRAVLRELDGGDSEHIIGVAPYLVLQDDHHAHGAREILQPAWPAQAAPAPHQRPTACRRRPRQRAQSCVSPRPHSARYARAGQERRPHVPAASALCTRSSHVGSSSANAALSYAVSLSSVRANRSPPCSSNRATTARWPRPAASTGRRPRTTRTDTRSGVPVLGGGGGGKRRVCVPSSERGAAAAADVLSGVWPCSARALTSAPRPMSTRATWTWPWLHALCSAVHPNGSR